MKGIPLSLVLLATGCLQTPEFATSDADVDKADTNADQGSVDVPSNDLDQERKKIGFIIDSDKLGSNPDIKAHLESLDYEVEQIEETKFEEKSNDFDLIVIGPDATGEWSQALFSIAVVSLNPEIAVDLGLADALERRVVATSEYSYQSSGLGSAFPDQGIFTIFDTDQDDVVCFLKREQDTTRTIALADNATAPMCRVVLALDERDTTPTRIVMHRRVVADLNAAPTTEWTDDAWTLLTRAVTWASETPDL